MRIKRYPGFHFQVSYFCYGSVQMSTCFILDRQIIRSGFAEPGKIPVGIYYHQVYIKRYGSDFFYCFDNRESEGDIWDKNTIHNIEMKPVGFTPVYHFYLTFEIGKISCKQ